MSAFDVLILGGGAAGLLCAATAAERGRSVLVVDHAAKLGRKILISGGGRCNFTNRTVGPEHFRSANPHFARSALARYRPEDFIALVDGAGIAWHERRHGQLFCDVSAKDIVALLLRRCESAGVRFALGQSVVEVGRDAAGFALRRSGDAAALRGTNLVVATGGLSVPTVGASDLGLRLATQFGLRLIPTAPALVPLNLPGTSELSGVAVDAVVSLPGHAFQENVLFTHGGLSGPAILQISTWWEPGMAIGIDLLPSGRVDDLIRNARQAGSKLLVANLLSDALPKRLVHARLAGLPAMERTVQQLDQRDITAISEAIHTWRIIPTGTAGYSKAEATRGGIDTRDLSSQTMAARTVPGLYAIGEVVDVTGWLGGYNFHWAWASGHAAGLVV